MLLPGDVIDAEVVISPDIQAAALPAPAVPPAPPGVDPATEPEAQHTRQTCSLLAVVCAGARRAPGLKSKANPRATARRKPPSLSGSGAMRTLGTPLLRVLAGLFAGFDVCRSD